MCGDTHWWVVARLDEVSQKLKSALWVILLNGAVNQAEALST